MPTILLVGDAAGSVHALSAAVPATHSVRLVATGREALIAAATGVPPALLLLDASAPVDMPVAELVSLLAAVPTTAQVPVAQVSLLDDGTALPQVEWLTPRASASAELAQDILRVHVARTARSHEAKASLHVRMTDLSQQASRTLIQRQMAQQVARWLNAPPAMAEVVSRVISGDETSEQGLQQLRAQLRAEPRRRVDVAEVDRVLERLSGMVTKRWR
jgi:CheY-like chemotaxis protein